MKSTCSIRYYFTKSWSYIYMQALQSLQSALWKESMQSKIRSVHENQTWGLVPREDAINFLTWKRVFKVKAVVKEDGSLGERYKARLVARGFQQVQVMDYVETFAPFVSITSLRLFLSWKAAEDPELPQMDVKSAFMHGNLDESIYVEQPRVQRTVDTESCP